MDTKLAETLYDYRTGKISQEEAILRIRHVCLTDAHQKIEDFEGSEKHAIGGIPISDLFESEILLPLALQLE